MNELKWAWTSVCGLYRLVAHLSGFSTAIAPNPLWKTPPHVGYNANKSSLQAQAKALKKTVVTKAFVIFPGLSHFVLRILPLLWSTAPFWRLGLWVAGGEVAWPEMPHPCTSP